MAHFGHVRQPGVLCIIGRRGPTRSNRRTVMTDTTYDAARDEIDTLRLAIAGYDALRVADIIPQLKGLDPAQLRAIERHENEGKRRSMILKRIATLRAGSPAATPQPATWAPPAAPWTTAAPEPGEGVCAAGHPATGADRYCRIRSEER